MSGKESVADGLSTALKGCLYIGINPHFLTFRRGEEQRNKERKLHMG